MQHLVCAIFIFQTRSRENLVAANTQREGSGVLGATTLFGRLGQALKSDTYGDFRLGQLTQANIVAVSG